MARYDFKCGQGHVNEETFEMGDAPAAVTCRDCGEPAKRVFSLAGVETIIPARWHYDKAGVREVTGGHSMQDIRHNGELRRQHLPD